MGLIVGYILHPYIHTRTTSSTNQAGNLFAWLWEKRMAYRMETSSEPVCWRGDSRAHFLTSLGTMLASSDHPDKHWESVFFTQPIYPAIGGLPHISPFDHAHSPYRGPSHPSCAAHFAGTPSGLRLTGWGKPGWWDQSWRVRGCGTLGNHLFGPEGSSPSLICFKLWNLLESGGVTYLLYIGI